MSTLYARYHSDSKMRMWLPQLITHLVILSLLLGVYLTLSILHESTMQIGGILAGYLGARGVDVGFTAVRNGHNKP